MSSQHDSHNEHHKGEKSPHFIVPIGTMVAVWIALLIGTVLTVAVSYVDFGSMNMFIAMLVATCKAGLVMAFFMGLKYDTAENSVTFLLSFLFLGIFITLVSFDVFWRPDQQAAQIDKSGSVASSGSVDVKKLSTRTPAVMEKGKTLFSSTCAVCHGAEGRGDGPAAVALNPKPRNFADGAGWKNGRKISGIFKTITEGIKGSGMAAYNGLAVEDRFAIAHYVQSLGPAAPADSAEDLAALGLDKQAKPELTVAEGMARLVGKGAATAPKAYKYVQGEGYQRTGDQPEPQSLAPKNEYCKLPVQYRPKYCP